MSGVDLKSLNGKGEMKDGRGGTGRERDGWMGVGEDEKKHKNKN